MSCGGGTRDPAWRDAEVRWRILSLMTDVIEATSPMGEPSRVAFAGSNTWAPGIAD